MASGVSVTGSCWALLAHLPDGHPWGCPGQSSYFRTTESLAGWGWAVANQLSLPPPTHPVAGSQTLLQVSGSTLGEGVGGRGRWAGWGLCPLHPERFSTKDTSYRPREHSQLAVAG